VSDPAEAAILAAVAAGRSVAPADVARALGGNPPDESWRRFLHPVRLAAVRLERAGQIEFLRKGKVVTGADARGVVRLRAVQK